MFTLRFSAPFSVDYVGLWNIKVKKKSPIPQSSERYILK